MKCILFFALLLGLVSCEGSSNHYEGSMLNAVVFNKNAYDTKGGRVNYIVIGDAVSNTYRVEVDDTSKYRLGQKVQYILIVEKEQKATIKSK